MHFIIWITINKHVRKKEEQNYLLNAGDITKTMPKIYPNETGSGGTSRKKRSGSVQLPRVC